MSPLMIYQVAAEAEHCRPSGGGGWYPEEQELSSILNIIHHVGYLEIKGRDFFEIFQVLYGTLLHLPPRSSTVSEETGIEPSDFGIFCRTL